MRRSSGSVFAITTRCCEWNDRLNLNLALVGSSFGRRARDHLDFKIYETFKQAGGELETLYRQFLQQVSSAADDAPADPEAALNPTPDLLVALEDLNVSIYDLILFMNNQLLVDEVGRRADQRISSPELAVHAP